MFRHFVKGIKVRLLKAAKLKSCKVLSKWVPGVCTMVYHTLYNSGGKSTLLSNTRGNVVLYKVKASTNKIKKH